MTNMPCHKDGAKGFLNREQTGAPDLTLPPEPFAYGFLALVALLVCLGRMVITSSKLMSSSVSLSLIRNLPNILF